VHYCKIVIGKKKVQDSDHYDVDRIFVSLSWKLHCWWHLDRALYLSCVL